jgi:shikimate dehydrogenase
MKINQHSQLYGVIGNPVRHSLSPAMHNAAFKDRGINAVYLAFEVSDLEGCLRGVRSLNIKGLSVTIPFKENIIPLLNEVDPLAKGIGAVNTVVNDNGCLKGYNTDAMGALRALEEKTSLAGKRFCIIGAGGAARAIGYILKQKGVEITIANRSQARGAALAKALGCGFVSMRELAKAGYDILINTTPVGMSPDVEASPVTDDMLRQGMVVMDVIYNPFKTKLLAMAETKGCTIINGLPMFIHQGAEQFRLWTGVDTPVDVMNDAVREALGLKP